MIREQLMKRIILAIALAVATSGAVVATTSAPAMASPVCFTTVRVESTGLYGTRVPSAGYDAASTHCHLQVGYSSEAVRHLQRTLNDCYHYRNGVFSPALVEDGNFGAKTKAALIAAQRHERISADGGYGPQTRDALQHTLRVPEHPDWADCLQITQPPTLYW